MKHAPRGFALNDLLAILMIAGVGSMLWLAAVKIARDASRRLQCVNNLKQIGVALHHYHATHGSFPLGVTASFNRMSESDDGAGVKVAGEPNTWSGWSAQALLLNYLDQTPLYNSINFDFEPRASGAERPFNDTAIFTKVGIFLCPTDPYAGRPNLNSYYASIGTNVQSRAHHPTGVFGYQFLCRARDITDGESNTVAFAEGLSGTMRPTRYRGNGVINFGTKFPDPDSAHAERFPDQLMSNLQACHDGFQGPRGPAAISGDRGMYWGWGSEAMTLFNTIVPPNSNRYAFNHCRYECLGCYLADSDHSDIVSASSYHPGGANALFCDGNVRFIKGSMAMPTWWALGTRGLGDAISADSY